MANLAEYHARTTVRDGQVLRLLEGNGFAIVEHQKNPAAKTRTVQFLIWRFRWMENFKVIAGEADSSVRREENGMHTANGNFCEDVTSERPGILSRSNVSPRQGLWKMLQDRWAYLTTQESFRQEPLMIASRLISWRIRCLLQRPTIVSLPEWDARMFLPPEWRGIAKLVFAFRESYEPELPFLKIILSPGKIFVDVGASIGIYTLAASKIVGDTGRVLAFEPSVQTFSLLANNIVLNGLTNVQAFPLALAQKHGTAWLHHGPNSSLDALEKDSSSRHDGEEIVTESLTRVLQRARVDRVDVIKMDVQGAEELVLQGAVHTLTSARPVIIFEVWPEGAALLGLSPYGPWNLLESIGYEFFVVGRRGTLSSIKSPPTTGNVVAIHREMKGKLPPEAKLMRGHS